MSGPGCRSTDGDVVSSAPWAAQGGWRLQVWRAPDVAVRGAGRPSSGRGRSRGRRAPRGRTSGSRSRTSLVGRESPDHGSGHRPRCAARGTTWRCRGWSEVAAGRPASPMRGPCRTGAPTVPDRAGVHRTAETVAAGTCTRMGIFCQQDCGTGCVAGQRDRRSRLLSERSQVRLLPGALCKLLAALACSRPRDPCPSSLRSLVPDSSPLLQARGGRERALRFARLAPLAQPPLAQPRSIACQLPGVRYSTLR